MSALTSTAAKSVNRPPVYNRLSPAQLTEAFRKMLDLNDGQLRFMGLLSMLAGVSLVLIVR